MSKIVKSVGKAVKGVVKGVGKVASGVGNFVKRNWKILALAAIAYFTFGTGMFTYASMSGTGTSLWATMTSSVPKAATLATTTAVQQGGAQASGTGATQAVIGAVDETVINANQEVLSTGEIIQQAMDKATPGSTGNRVFDLFKATGKFAKKHPLLTIAAGQTLLSLATQPDRPSRYRAGAWFGMDKKGRTYQPGDPPKGVRRGTLYEQAAASGSAPAGSSSITPASYSVNQPSVRMTPPATAQPGQAGIGTALSNNDQPLRQLVNLS